MRHSRKLLAAAAIALGLAAAPAIQAETPADTLVMGWNIDDIISLDPAEVFEFSAAEIAGNTYERLVSYDNADVTNIYGQVAESWDVSDDGKTLTFQMKPGKASPRGNPMTADDAVFSLVRADQARQVAGLHPRPVRPDPGQCRGQWCKQIGDMTFTFTMTRPMRRPSCSTA